MKMLDSHFVRAVSVAAALFLPLMASAQQADAPAQNTDAAAKKADAERKIDFDRPRILFAGFENAADADPRDVWVPEAISEGLTERFRRAQGCITVPTIRAYQSREELTDPGGSPPEWKDVARALGATHLISGTCSGPPYRLNVELRLMRLDDDQAAVKTQALPQERLVAVLSEATRWVWSEVCASDPGAAVPESLLKTETQSVAALEYTTRATRAAREAKMDDALRYAQQAVASDKRYLPAQALLAQLELRAGAVPAATVRLRVVSAGAQASGDALARARAELAQSLVLHVQGNTAVAITRAETALGIAEEVGDPYGQIAALEALCDETLTRGADRDGPPDQVTDNARKAAEYQRRLMSILEQLGDRVGMLSAVNKLALLEERLGNLDAALKLHERTRTLAESLGAKRHQATAWLYIGQCQRKQKQYDAAVAALRKCLEMVQGPARPGVQMILAGTYVEMGSPELGLEQYRAAADALRGTEDLLALLTCLKEMAQTQKTLGQDRAAVESMQEAVDLAHVLEMKDEAALRTQLDAWKSELR